MNQPLLKRVARNSKRISRLARDIAELSSDFNQLDSAQLEPLEDFEKHWVTTAQALAICNRHWLELTDLVDTFKTRLLNASVTAGDAADYAVDTIQIVTQMEILAKSAYFPWARQTLALEPDLFFVAVKEVASHEGGGAHLERLQAAIEQLLEEVNSAAA